jgi:xylose isomerase
VARYHGWGEGIGRRILAGEADLAGLAAHAEAAPEPKPHSGRQEALENLYNRFA